MTEDQDVERLYVSDEPQEIEVKGVTVKYEELSGIEFSKLSDELGLNPEEPGSALNEEYFEKIIDKCVIEPELDVSRLKSDVLLEIVSSIQGEIDMGEGMDRFRPES